MVQFSCVFSCMKNSPSPESKYWLVGCKCRHYDWSRPAIHHFGTTRKFRIRPPPTEPPPWRHLPPLVPAMVRVDALVQVERMQYLVKQILYSWNLQENFWILKLVKWQHWSSDLKNLLSRNGDLTLANTYFFGLWPEVKSYLERIKEKLWILASIEVYVCF